MGSKPDFFSSSNFVLGFVYSAWEEESALRIEDVRIKMLEKSKGGKG